MDLQDTTLERINRLASEKSELYKAAGRTPMGDAERRRVETISSELERLWDQLRRERASRHHGPMRPGQRDLLERAA